MTTAYLVASLATLRAEFNHEFPTRDKGADGWIADAVHSSTSDHQPNADGAVRAIDIDTDVMRPGITLWDVCELLRGSPRLEYIIHRGQICSRSYGWLWRPYTGTSDHYDHAHFSARHDGYGWTNTAPWGLEDLMTKDEIKTAVAEVLAEYFVAGVQDGTTVATSKIGRDALNQGVPNTFRGTKTPAWQLLGDIAAAVKPATNPGV